MTTNTIAFNSSAVTPVKVMKEESPEKVIKTPITPKLTPDRIRHQLLLAISPRSQLRLEAELTQELTNLEVEIENIEHPDPDAEEAKE